MVVSSLVGSVAPGDREESNAAYEDDETSRYVSRQAPRGRGPRRPCLCSSYEPHPALADGVRPETVRYSPRRHRGSSVHGENPGQIAAVTHTHAGRPK